MSSRNPEVVALQQAVAQLRSDAQADRTALRTMMSILEDTLPVQDAHDLLEQTRAEAAAGIAALERRLDSQHGVAAGRGATSSSPHRPSSIGDDVRALGERHEHRMVSLEEALTVERQQRESLANVVRILADSSDGHIAELEASVHRQLAELRKELDGAGDGAEPLVLAETLRSLVREEMAPHVLEIRAAEIVSQTVTRHVDALQGEFDEQKEALVKVETVATDAVAAAQGLQAEAAQGRAAKEREMEKRFVQQQQRAAQDASEELEAMDKKLTAECTALQAKLTAERQGESRALEALVGRNERLMGGMRNEMGVLRTEVAAATVQLQALQTRLTTTVESSLQTVAAEAQRVAAEAAVAGRENRERVAALSAGVQSLERRIDRVDVEQAKLGVQTAEAGRAVAASAREMNKTLQEVQQGYESYGAKLAEHEGKLRRLLGEYGVLAAGQDRSMEKLRSECGEAVGAAVQAAARLEQGAAVLESRVAAADAMAQEVREEVSRVGVKVAAELAKSTTEFERRADVLSADKERGESARLSLQRQVEARCTEMEQLSNRDHSATERRVLALERQLRAGTSEAVEQVQGKLLETTRQMEQKLSRVQELATKSTHAQVREMLRPHDAQLEQLETRVDELGVVAVSLDKLMKEMRGMGKLGAPH